MGLRTGEPQVGGERYVGLAVHRAARIRRAGHGGQVLLSHDAGDVEDDLCAGLSIRDLGERRLKDVAGAGLPARSRGLAQRVRS